MIGLCDALLAAAANARSWLAGPGDPAPAKQRHGWLRQCHRISHMNEVERMSSIPTPSFPRKREPSAFGVGFRRTGSASHWVDQLTLLKCASAFAGRSEEHTSELQSLMRISYAVFCLKKQNINKSERVSTIID